MKQNKKTFLAFVGGMFLMALLSLPLRSLVSAEQSGSTPNSGATSYIKNLYDSLVLLGNGSDSSGSWGDWGNMWNRIRSSSEWVPTGDATAGDVVTGKTFYGDDRMEITGTLTFTGDATVDDVVSGKTFYSDSLNRLIGSAPTPVDWGTFSQLFVDDGASDDETKEESSWENTSTNVWKDLRTGLYWSNDLGSYTNNFSSTKADCDFFGVSSPGAYPEETIDPDCGNAINACANLSLDKDGDSIDDTDWYLPSQKELMLAYIDGMYNQTGSSFSTWNEFWSSTQLSCCPNMAYAPEPADGYLYQYDKNTSHRIRCVARD